MPREASENQVGQKPRHRWKWYCTWVQNGNRKVGGVFDDLVGVYFDTSKGNAHLLGGLATFAVKSQWFCAKRAFCDNSTFSFPSDANEGGLLFKLPQLFRHNEACTMCNKTFTFRGLTSFPLKKQWFCMMRALCDQSMFPFASDATEGKN